MAESMPNAAELMTTLHDSDKTHKTVEHVTEEGLALDLDGESGDGDKHQPAEALETHEVVELNKFTTKKEWIEDKIKFLESIPPVEVFAAVETLVAMRDEIPPGLPTRGQLDHWLEEQDKIEKETEIFDAEDMSKLKKLTKAATQRNLSSEDTDLIELTLTTLIALDKLLHLLRDRSEMLDLLALRLTWEEQRVVAWRDWSAIVYDLHSFLARRARWSLESYEFPPPSTPSPTSGLRFPPSSPSSSPRSSTSPSQRRDSAASTSSETSISSKATSAFSRSIRYKLAEMLSHDAALFSGRITALNHGKITPAGKTLDKLIDASHTAVPDEILDAQDLLEDKGIKEIETVGKFAMNVVMQWKRADEYYNDAKKDHVAAQALIAELNNSRLQHPTARHDAAFMSRARALTKRLAVKGDPSLLRSSFPRPMHPLFPDQNTSNDAIIESLSTEFAEAAKLAREAETAAIAYHTGLEAVKRVESLCDQIHDLDEQFKKLAASLVYGMHDEGSPFDLNKDVRFDPTRHAAYIAFLPSVVQQLEMVDRTSEVALRDGGPALLDLKELPGVDVNLKQELSDAMAALESRRSTTKRAIEDALGQSHRLKETMRLWDILTDIMRSLDGLMKVAVDGMESQRWKVREDRGGAPMTPDADSPTSSDTPLLATLTPVVLRQRLDELERHMSTEVNASFSVLARTLEPQLNKHLLSSSQGLSKYIDDIRSMARLWDDILKQAQDMLSVKCGAQDLEVKIDTLQAGVDDTRQEVSDRGLTLEKAASLEVGFRAQANALHALVRTFTDSLAGRVPLVSRSETQIVYRRSDSASPYSLLDDKNFNSLKGRPWLPFDPKALDNGVRAEVNALALGLAGKMQLVDKNLDYLCLAHLAKSTDAALEGLTEDIRSVEETLSVIKRSFESTKEMHPSHLLQELSSIREQLDLISRDHRPHTLFPTSPVRQALDALQTARGAHDSPSYGTVVAPHAKTVDETLRRANSVSDTFVRLKIQVMDAERTEEARLRMEKERLELEEECRLKGGRLEAAEMAKLDKERMEMMRKEKERLETEEDGRLSRFEAGESLKQRRFNEEHVEADKARVDEEDKAKQSREQGKVHSRELQRNPSPKFLEISGEDVFGPHLALSTSSVKPLSEATALRNRIVSLRSRLRSLHLNRLVFADAVTPENQLANLPTSGQALDAQSKFSVVLSESVALPVSVAEDTIDSELKLLRSEVDSAQGLVKRVCRLAHFNDSVAVCDHALSDLLEHADTYPAAPSIHDLASTHVSDTRLPCEDQLANRLAFTKRLVEEMSRLSSSLIDDPRVVTEERRLQQTASELTEMCTDRINGTRSRPTSSISSTDRSSVGSVQRNPKPSFPSQARRHPRASESASRRTSSSFHDPVLRPSTHLSNRSVSGPSGLSSLLSTTFASRQRTTSLASIQSAVTTPVKRSMSPITKPRTVSKRTGSPTFSELLGNSITSTPSRSTWSRTPRQSFGAVSRSFQTPNQRKAYVANPKSKLDVAVGNVVNNFKVPVAIQAADGWRDLSGKYWIGETEPKLCFCRILRSQTVMVRVGGGWCELSNFLRGHFAELPVDLPPSPPRREERWISSATIREASETPGSTTVGPVFETPKHQETALLPTIHLFTTDSGSPQSPKSSSSRGGSPSLTPFQFMRKADLGARAATPSPAKGAGHKLLTLSAPVTPARTNIWRP